MSYCSCPFQLPGVLPDARTTKPTREVRAMKSKKPRLQRATDLKEADCNKLIQDMLDAQEELGILVGQIHRLFCRIRAEGVRLQYFNEDPVGTLTEQDLCDLDELARLKGEREREEYDKQQVLDEEAAYQASKAAVSATAPTMKTRRAASQFPPLDIR